MKLYRFFANGDNALNLVDLSGFGYHWNHFVGKPMLQEWYTPKFSILARSRPLRDFVSWNLDAPLVTKRARESLEPVIGPFVEFLPFAVINGVHLDVINVLEVIDCLDLQASQMSYAPDEPGKVIFVSKFVFDAKKVREVPIFKVPQMFALFVSDVFAQTVVRNKLTGAMFADPENTSFVKKRWNRKMEGLPPVKDFAPK